MGYRIGEVAAVFGEMDVARGKRPGQDNLPAQSPASGGPQLLGVGGLEVRLIPGGRLPSGPCYLRRQGIGDGPIIIVFSFEGTCFSAISLKRTDRLEQNLSTMGFSNRPNFS